MCVRGNCRPFNVTGRILPARPNHAVGYACAKLADAVKRISHWLAFASILLLLANPAEAAEQRYQLLLDTDNDAATGCVVSAGGTSAPGVETVLTAVVNTTTTSVTVVRLERQTCSGGVLGAPVTYNNGGWNVGLGNGTGGASVVESEVALASLPVGTFKAWGLGIDSNGATDWTAPFFITVASGPRSRRHAGSAFQVGADTARAGIVRECGLVAA